MNIDFAMQARQWASPPVDDIGYIPSFDLMRLSDEQLRNIIEKMRFTRYSEQAWRNWEGKYRKGLRMDQGSGQCLLDFGCGVGMESQELASAGYKVSVADINWDNLNLATRVMGLWSDPPARPESMHLIRAEYPFIETDEQFDVIHCSGVLHHIPWAKAILGRFSELLLDKGEVHLMLYSDRGWRTFIGTEPPQDVITDPNFQNFVRTFDQVGQYADWYDEAKLTRMAEDWFTVKEFQYITVDDRYCTAILEKK